MNTTFRYLIASAVVWMLIFSPLTHSDSTDPLKSEVEQEVKPKVEVYQFGAVPMEGVFEINHDGKPTGYIVEFLKMIAEEMQRETGIPVKFNYHTTALLEGIDDTAAGKYECLVGGISETYKRRMMGLQFAKPTLVTHLLLAQTESPERRIWNYLITLYGSIVFWSGLIFGFVTFGIIPSVMLRAERKARPGIYSNTWSGISQMSRHVAALVVHRANIGLKKLVAPLSHHLLSVAVFTFTVTIMQVLASMTAAAIDPETDEHNITLNDIPRARVGVKTGSTGEKETEEFSFKHPLVRTNTSGELAEALLSGKVDYIVADATWLHVKAKMTKGFYVVGKPFAPQVYGIPCHGSSTLFKRLDDARSYIMDYRRAELTKICKNRLGVSCW